MDRSIPSVARRTRLRWAIAVLGLVGSTALAACQTDSSGGTATEIRLGHHHAVDGVVDHYATTFADEVNARTDGDLEVKVFPGGQLGDERSAADSVLSGSLDATIVSSIMFDRKVPQFGIDMLPFAFDNWDHLVDTFEGPVGHELESQLIDSGGRILGWIALGPRHLFFADTGIAGPEDIQGLTFRSPESDLFVDTFRAFGMKPTAVTWGEVYTALQTGVVDGVDGPAVAATDMALQEVTNSVLITGHMWGTMNLTINDELHQGLDEERKRVVEEAAKVATQAAIERAQADEEAALEKLRSANLEIVELDDPGRSLFQDATRGTIDDWAEAHQAQDLVQQLFEQSSGG